MKNKKEDKFKGPVIILGIFLFISLFFSLMQLVSFIFLLREIPGLLDLILLK